MKFEIVECPQCGIEFKRTNPRKEYCSGACRVGAHRDRHGYQMPIFDKEQVRLVEQVLEIPMSEFDNLVQDAIKYRIIAELYARAIRQNSPTEKVIFKRVLDIVEMEENVGGAVCKSAIDSILFIYPLNELLEYVKNNPVTLYKRGIL